MQLPRLQQLPPPSRGKGCSLPAHPSKPPIYRAEVKDPGHPVPNVTGCSGTAAPCPRLVAASPVNTRFPPNCGNGGGGKKPSASQVKGEPKFESWNMTLPEHVKYHLYSH